MNLTTVPSAALHLFLCLVAGCTCHKAPLDRSQLTREQVMSLLKEVPHDERMSKQRASFSGHGFTQVIPDTVWAFLFGRSYSVERLLARGDAGVDALFAIATDPATRPDIRNIAWLVIAQLDDPRTLPVLLAEYDARRITVNTFAEVLDQHLPMTRWRNAPDFRELPEWLRGELAVASPDEVCLRVYDRAFADPGNFLTERWLDRFGTRDVTKFLAARSECASAFRKRQLARGYDPAFHLAFCGMGEARYGKLTSMAAALYDDEEDRQGFVELVRCFTVMWKNPSAPGDEDLAVWFSRNRKLLKYDRSVHHFVVRKD